MASLPFLSLNDSALTCLLSEQHNYPLQVIDDMVYDPFPLIDDRNPVDNHLVNNLQIPDCNYVCVGTGSKPKLSSPGLNLLSHNISSIPLHLESLIEQVLNPLHVTFDVLCFCETRLNDDISPLYHIDNYNSFFINKSTQGGGLAVYLHNNFEGLILQNVSLQLPHIQSLFINITQPHKCIIGLVYRPPNENVGAFLQSMEFILESLIAVRELRCYIMGDMNLNLLNYNENNVHNYINLFFSHMFFPTITKPTRVTKTCASLLDHVWTNDLQNYQSSGIIFTSISDHFPVFSIFSIDNNVTRNTSTILKRRNFSDEGINAFKLDLINFKRNLWVMDGDVDTIYNKYMQTFSVLYDKHFPIKTTTFKEKHTDKPYITQSIKNSIKQRNKLQALYAKWPLTYERTFKNYRNTLTSSIRAAKNAYYKSLLHQHAGNANKTWGTINMLMGKKSQNKIPTTFTFQDKVTANKQEIADKFNDYFSSVASTLAQNVQPTLTPFSDYLPEPVPFSFFLRPTTSPEIIAVIHNLKGTSAGHDEVSVRVIKKCSNEVSPFLEFIINRSFQSGFFPKSLQIARVVPVHKKGDKSIPCNYRPISILPVFSKIFEKIVAKRLLDYLTEKSLLTPHQFGFRPKYSTDLAIHHLCQNMYNAIDGKKYQLTVFCDLSKAFDTISHPILLRKLLVYGIRGPAHHWFESYLSFRKQCTVINNVSSPLKSLSYGVPQGSVLGPILFLLYINDITRSSSLLNFLLFADDTSIFVQGGDLKDLENTVNVELVHVGNWLKSNKLTLNINKTQFMISHPLMSLPLPIKLKIDNIMIQQVSEMKFLGITIDCKLVWKQHIFNVKTKISKLMGVMYKIRHLLNSACLKQVYYSLVYPHLLYCSALWGGAYRTYLDTILISQKKILRCMYFKQFNDHTSPLFLENNILKLDDIILLQTMLFVHGALHSHPVNSGFHLAARNVQTRRTNDLPLPLCRTSHAQQCIIFRGSKLWNDLPVEIRTIIPRNSFKKHVKHSLFLRY